MKKILLIAENINTDNLPIYLKNWGYEVITWYIPCNEHADQCADMLHAALDESYYGVFMYDYNPRFAKVCYDMRIYYITWIVDNPQFSLWSETISYPTNRIFVFDRSQYQQLKERAIGNFFYLPLGADVDSFAKCKNYKPKFDADVSFVGNLYNDKTCNLFQQIAYFPPYVMGYLTALIQSQQKLVNRIIRKEIIPNNVWKDIKAYVKLEQVEAYDFLFEEWFVSILQREVTMRERCQAVTLLNHFFDFKLYSGSDTTFDPLLKSEGYINYKTEMPLIFRQSKVNINITLRSITSGIPLRALDIMACGGFLLSNYQGELIEFFEEGKECVCFFDIKDMIDKADFYLKHESERKRIAQKGYEKVKHEFSLDIQLGKMKTLLEANE